ncbi:HK97 family phage prohead protease [Dactylosporangium sp. NPDC005572]|uniref:HK97 family phage prohead protease n=1 Tax=Dactylosporangium sp. NPDC005572 TaxID=3156889 RepID=UPI0033A174D3
MMSDLERRYSRGAVELVEATRRKIGGYAAKFRRRSKDLGGFVEEIEPAFFNRSKGNGWPDVLARYNHDDNYLLGTTGGGTLLLDIDDTGLRYEVDPPASRADVYELVQRGDVRASSFAFRLPTGGDEWGLTEDQGYPLRRLLTGQLVDVAPVNTPAYPDATAGLRSLARWVDADIREVRAAARTNELRRFLTNTGSTAPMPQPARTGVTTVRGPVRELEALLARRTDPWEHPRPGPRTLSGHTAAVLLEARSTP